MKTWKLAHDRLPCGSVPDCWIEQGDPYLELTGPGWKIRRCGRHTTEAIPAEIHSEPIEAWRPPVAVTRPDPKMAAAGKDE